MNIVCKNQNKIKKTRQEKKEISYLQRLRTKTKITRFEIKK